MASVSNSFLFSHFQKYTPSLKSLNTVPSTVFKSLFHFLTSESSCGWPHKGFVIVASDWVIFSVCWALWNFGYYIFPWMELISFVGPEKWTQLGKKTTYFLPCSSGFLVLSLLTEILESSHKSVILLPRVAKSLHISACLHLKNLPSCQEHRSCSSSLLLSLMCQLFFLVQKLFVLCLQGLEIVFSSSKFMVAMESFLACIWAFGDSRMWKKLILFWALHLKHRKVVL